MTSSTFGLTQNLLLHSPTIKRRLGIPETPSELSHPYEHLQKTIKSRLSFKPPIHENPVSNTEEKESNDIKTKK